MQEFFAYVAIAIYYSLLNNANMIKNSIRARLSASEMTLDNLAEKTGISTSHLSRLQSGKRRLNEESAEKIARAFGCSVAGVFEDTGNLPKSNSLGATLEPYLESKFYIHGELQAGRPTFIMDEPIEPKEPFFHRIEDDERFSDAPRFGLRVIGDSMDLVAPHGSIVICVKLIDIGYQPQNGDYVVISHRTTQGFMEATLKQFIEEDGRAILRPVSSKPEHQEDIEINDHGEEEHTQIIALAVAMKRTFI